MAASHLNATHWIVAVPDEQANAKGIVDRFVAEQHARDAKCADVSVFDVPWRSLKVGSLDSLMALADDLARVDTFCEGVTRKVERQWADAHTATVQADYVKARKAAGSTGPAVDPDIPALAFTVGNKPVHEFIKAWKWDVEQFDASREALPELVRRVVAAAERVDGELRVVAAAYNEKKTALQTIERRRAGNLMVCGLEEVVTPAVLSAAGVEWIGPDASEYLQSALVVVPKTAEEAWLAGYAALDGGSVPVGPEGNRGSVTTSPVVPGSAKKLSEDKDGYALYAVVILKKFADSFRAAAREKRYIVRDFAFDPSAATAGERKAAALEVDVAASLSSLRSQAALKYGEALSMWLHVKAIRVFVDAVLRYGLPVKFAAVLLAVQKGSGRKALETVQGAWAKIAASAGIKDVEDVGTGSGKKAAAAAAADAAALAGVGGDATKAHFAFVFSDMDVKPTSAVTDAK